MRIIKSLTGVVLRRTTAATLVAMAALSMSARPPIYMKYDGIKGQATPSAADSHKETIEIASWSFGASNPTATGGNRVQGNTIGTDPAAARPARSSSRFAERFHPAWPRCARHGARSTTWCSTSTE